MRGMNSISHRDKSLQHVEAVVQTAAYVNDLHAEREHAANRADIARGYDSIRQGLKLAEVHALLAVAEAIESSGKPSGPVTM